MSLDVTYIQDGEVKSMKWCFVLLTKLTDSEIRKYSRKAPSIEEDDKSVRPEVQRYITEFEKYLRNLQDEKKKYKILKELEKKGIEKDLRIKTTAKGAPRTNAKLVKWIMENQSDSHCLDKDWFYIDEAIMVLLRANKI